MEEVVGELDQVRVEIVDVDVSNACPTCWWSRARRPWLSCW
jgi:hypothetical protein